MEHGTDSPHSEWLFSDIELNRGVSFPLKYVGCISVRSPIRSLEFKERTAIVKTSINIVARAAGLLKSSMDGAAEQQAQQMAHHLGEKADIEPKGVLNVSFIVNTESLMIKEPVANGFELTHEMQTISFASGGEQETDNYVAYVAKNPDGSRYCYVILCDGPDSQAGEVQTAQVIKTIGQAFDIRFRQFKEQQNKTVSNGALLTSESSAFSPVNRTPQQPAPQPAAPQPTAASSVYPDNEPWFHGMISRDEAEQLIQSEGEFLVREKASTKTRQFVLSARAKGGVKHLLLVEPDTGEVRTKDHVFDSISHLIRHHHDSNRPIISQDQELIILTQPIART